jgi:hypothetical protein
MFSFCLKKKKKSISPLYLDFSLNIVKIIKIPLFFVQKQNSNVSIFANSVKSLLTPKFLQFESAYNLFQIGSNIFSIDKLINIVSIGSNVSYHINIFLRALAVASF